jgi:ferredoxin
MCEFCAEHGEGKEWYLAAKNYSKELLTQKRREHISQFFRDFEAGTAGALATLDRLGQMPFVATPATNALVARQKKSHFGQVVPLEDADRVLDLVDSVVRLPCACRSLTTGRMQPRYCFGLGVDPGGWLEELPEFAQGLEVLSREQAKAAIRSLDVEGLVHSVWTFDTPFIAGLCNCDQDCVAYRLQVGTGMMQVFFPAEQVAVVDPERCNGCRRCRTQCSFGAVRYSAGAGKCSVDSVQCYGCGVCRAACAKEAISLAPRQVPFRWQRRPVAAVAHRVSVRPCADARACRKCLEACPTRVLGTAPRRARTAGVAAADWQVRVLTPSRCTGCGACATACPEGAIAVA